MAGGSGTKVVQITNIAPQATKDQMQTFLGTVGKIDEIRLYPTIRDVSCPVVSRICYVKYFESSCVAVAQHLTNTVFIDRAVIVIPVQGGVIPDEYKALEMAANGTLVPGLHSFNVPSKLPPEVVNRIDGMIPNQVVKTIDPKLEENGLPEYPPLPVNFDAKKIEETRRTILVLDVRSDWRLEDLMDHFKPAGEIKYARYAENDRSKFALLEFCDQRNIISALKMHGTEFRGYRLNVHHSTQPIVKPEAKSNEAAQKEIEEAMTIVKEAHHQISNMEPVVTIYPKDKSSSRLAQQTVTFPQTFPEPFEAFPLAPFAFEEQAVSLEIKTVAIAQQTVAVTFEAFALARPSQAFSFASPQSHAIPRTFFAHPPVTIAVEETFTFARATRTRKRSTSRSRASRTKEAVTKSSSKRRSRTPSDKRLKKILEEAVSRDYDAEERMDAVGVGVEDDAGSTGKQSASPPAQAACSGGSSSSSSSSGGTNAGAAAAPVTPREKTASPTTEKSDNMDISNSP
uniref:RRM domain-containing protein n=1 Tax=Anopheles minimus TaxID=112268 RepID=A0A182VQ09_9DIPT